jgi:Zn-dependent peptidase ImmA (M78 family)
MQKLVKFEPKRLQQARFLKRMTLADVGAIVDVTRQSLSLFENGERAPAPETIEKLSLALGVPIEFFLRPVGILEAKSRSMVHYRSLRRTREIIREQQRASALIDLCAAVADSLEEHVDYDVARVPSIEASIDPLLLSSDEVEEIASATRRALGIGDGPISDVSLLVENQAVIVVRANLSEGMDGLSAWYGDRPFIVVSSAASYARDRMNVAHEFGHLVLHKEIGGDGMLDLATFKLIESQAWRFAGAFLLPAKSFLSEMYSVSLDALVTLKKKWGVSVAAMIRRLADLKVIDADQQRYLNIQLRQRGWHKNEPGDDALREKGRLLNRTAIFLEESGEITLSDLALESKLPRDFLAAALEVDKHRLAPPQAAANVLQFRVKGTTDS